MTREERATAKINDKMAQIKNDLENAATLREILAILARYDAEVHSIYKFKKGKKQFIEGEIKFNTNEQQSEYPVFSRIHYRSKGSLFAHSYCIGAYADSYTLSDRTINLILGVF